MCKDQQISSIIDSFSLLPVHEMRRNDLIGPQFHYWQSSDIAGFNCSKQMRTKEGLGKKIKLLEIIDNCHPHSTLICVVTNPQTTLQTQDIRNDESTFLNARIHLKIIGRAFWYTVLSRCNSDHLRGT